MGKYQTDKRKQLTAFLEANPDMHFSAKQISESIDGISLSAVYRNLAVCESDDFIIDTSATIFYDVCRACSSEE